MGDGMSELNFKPTYKCRFPIIFFAWLALFFRIIGSSRFFISYWDGMPHFDFPSGISLLYLFINLSAVVLLVIYLTWFHIKGKASIIIPIIFILYSTLCFIDAIDIIINDGLRYFSIYMILYFAFDIILFALYGISVIFAFKGLLKKAVPIIANIVGLLLFILNFVFNIGGLIYHISNGYLFYGIMQFFIIFALGLFHFVLLLFCATNKIRPIVAPSAQSNQPVDFNSLQPEQALVVLNNSFQSGQVSFEQYKATREEILKKL
ncbi:MAG: hypothetical protein J6J30_02260 [Clostridia bacterium]|nr:hypothetical protein [Clostridia bacterium]